MKTLYLTMEILCTITNQRFARIFKLSVQFIISGGMREERRYRGEEEERERERERERKPKKRLSTRERNPKRVVPPLHWCPLYLLSSLIPPLMMN